MNKKILHNFKKISIGFLLLSFVLMMFSVNSNAAIYKKELVFDIEFSIDDEAVKDMPFSLYPIGYMENRKIVLRGAFSDLPVDFGDYKESDLIKASETLKNYLPSLDLEPLSSGVTDSEGKVTLSDMKPEVIPGVYLLVADKLETREAYYEASPMLVTLPLVDEKGDGIYHQSIFPKGKKEVRFDKVDLPVMKVWKDVDSDVHPSSVTVVLYKDKEVYDEVKLSKENNWKYEWKYLDERSSWTVLEKDVPDGYTVSIQEESGMVVITNKKKPEETKEPTTEEPTSEEPTSENPTTKPEEPTSKDPSEETKVPTSSEMEETVESSAEDISVTEEEASVPESKPSGTSEKPDILPVTGQIWWPVLLFAALGMIFGVIGILLHRKERK